MSTFFAGFRDEVFGSYGFQGEEEEEEEEEEREGCERECGSSHFFVLWGIESYIFFDGYLSVVWLSLSDFLLLFYFLYIMKIVKLQSKFEDIKYNFNGHITRII